MLLFVVVVVYFCCCYIQYIVDEFCCCCCLFLLLLYSFMEHSKLLEVAKEDYLPSEKVSILLIMAVKEYHAAINYYEHYACTLAYSINNNYI